jgi:DNA-binding NtrC family response regulator
MRARLTVEYEGNATVFELPADRPVTLGRSRENTIVLRDEHASRVHARLQYEDGRWQLSDLESRNGTSLDGQPVRRAVPLNHGQEIVIGATRMRFSVDSAETQTARHGPATQFIDPPGTTTTTLQTDDLTALCRFMTGAVEERDAHDLLRRALRTILKQTNASLAGYLGLDPGDPVPKLVLPDEATVDRQLSRQLTLRVQREGRTVWLGTDLATTQPTDSLVPFTDAIGLPVKADGEPVGAVHVYKANALFTERDVRFCEALVGYLAHGLHLLRTRRTLEAENSRLRGHLAAGDTLVGDSPALKNLRSLIARVAPQPSTVLIHGESGVGKELVALALHRQSRHAAGPLVAVNCAAIQQSMMEAELFGYRKGAFTGAERDYPGLFQQADEGTLFFDEVGELSAECQAKLLRVIEGKSFKPLGATAEVKADVRIVAATNRNLEKEVKAGRFRADLFYRLKVVTVPVPPLREHAEDIPLLVQHFLDTLARECRRQVRLTPTAQRKLQNFSWPGNVRQLRAVLENAVVMAEGDVLDAGAFLLSDSSGEHTALMPLNLEALERWAIPEALKRTGGNKTQAAELLGISRETLANKLKKYALNGKDET